MELEGFIVINTKAHHPSGITVEMLGSMIIPPLYGHPNETV